MRRSRKRRTYRNRLEESKQKGDAILRLQKGYYLGLKIGNTYENIGFSVKGGLKHPTSLTTPTQLVLFKLFMAAFAPVSFCKHFILVHP